MALKRGLQALVGRYYRFRGSAALNAGFGRALGHCCPCTINQIDGTEKAAVALPMVDLPLLITSPYVAHCMEACSAKCEWSLLSLSLSSPPCTRKPNYT